MEGAPTIITTDTYKSDIPTPVHHHDEGISSDDDNDLNKSYESMKSNEKDPLHYEIDSDNEPPTDDIGDKITVVKRGQTIKEILEVS